MSTFVRNTPLGELIIYSYNFTSLENTSFTLNTSVGAISLRPYQDNPLENVYVLIDDKVYFSNGEVIDLKDKDNLSQKESVHFVDTVSVQ